MLMRCSALSLGNTLQCAGKDVRFNGVGTATMEEFNLDLFGSK